MGKESKVKFKANNSIGKDQGKGWVVKVTFMSLALSAVLYSLSQEVLKNSGYFISALVLIFIVILGILFDMIGIAVAASDESPFHAMASRKNSTGKRAIKLIRNANKVSSFCNDVVGDICGVISGTAITLIVLRISANNSVLDASITGVVFSSVIAALTIGGKAMGKTYALRNCNMITYRVSVLLNFFGGKIKGYNKESASKESTSKESTSKE
ncbi:MAG: Mg2+ and Co2+ transporter CorB [Eubacteriales bacterium]|nr:Mg2+ and Co2+ transporter CorB [Eubacteriales bacterium]